MRRSSSVEAGIVMRRISGNSGERGGYPRSTISMT